MDAWSSSLFIAILVSTVPFTLLLKVLNQIPGVLALSHRRWPLPLNYGLIAAVTSFTAYIVHGGYIEHRSPVQLLGDCAIVAIVYGFALSLLQRQFCGVYTEFIVSAGPVGFGLRKTRYRNIQDIGTIVKRRSETELRIETVQGRLLSFTLPNRYVSILFDQVQKKIQDG
jgi:hypothetical protein